MLSTKTFVFNLVTVSIILLTSSCFHCEKGYIEYSHDAIYAHGEDKVYGANKCEPVTSDIVRVVQRTLPERILYEGALTTIGVERLSKGGNIALGSGSLKLMYTIQHWETTDDDLEQVSGILEWFKQDVDGRPIEIMPIEDLLFELRESFWMRFMTLGATEDMVIAPESKKIEFEIQGPNDLFQYRGRIEILDANKQLMDNLTVEVEEANQTLTFYLRLADTTDYCEVFVHTTEESAIHGLDYIAMNQSVVWHPWDITEGKWEKAIHVTLKDDDIWESPMKNFSIEIWQSYGVAIPNDTIKIVIKDNDPPPSHCHLTEWSNYTECTVVRGNQLLTRWRIAGVPDALWYLHCDNVTESEVWNR